MASAVFSCWVIHRTSESVSCNEIVESSSYFGLSRLSFKIKPFSLLTKSLSPAPPHATPLFSHIILSWQQWTKLCRPLGEPASDEIQAPNWSKNNFGAIHVSQKLSRLDVSVSVLLWFYAFSRLVHGLCKLSKSNATGMGLSFSYMLNNSFSTAAASLIARLFQLFRWCGRSNEIWAEKKNRLLLWRSAHLSVLTSPSLEVWKQLRPCLKKLPLPAAYTETHELDLWQLSETLPLWLKRSKEFVNLGKAILLQVPNDKQSQQRLRMTLLTNFWTDKNVNAFRLHATCGTVQVFINGKQYCSL